MKFRSFNPTTGAFLREYDFLPSSEIPSRIAASYRAFQGYRKEPFAERKVRILALAQILTRRQEELASLITQEMGKPIAQARAEIQKCVQQCEFTSQQAEMILADRPINTEAQRTFVTYEPLGPLLNIMPWNFPVWVPFKGLVPQLAVGNTILMKHAPNTPQCALALEEVMHESGWDCGEYQNVFVDTEQVEDIVRHPQVRGISMTGSSVAGRKVAEVAGRHLKKVVLELGGQDPMLVLEDADLEHAVR